MNKGQGVLVGQPAATPSARWNSSARKSVGHRIIGDRRGYQVYLVWMRSCIIHEDANDIALFCILGRAPIEQGLPVLIGKGTELLNRGHEAQH
jgi:hypothetical protein